MSGKIEDSKHEFYKLFGLAAQIEDALLEQGQMKKDIKMLMEERGAEELVKPPLKFTSEEFSKVIRNTDAPIAARKELLTAMETIDQALDSVERGNYSLALLHTITAIRCLTNAQTELYQGLEEKEEEK